MATNRAFHLLLLCQASFEMLDEFCHVLFALRIHCLTVVGTKCK